MLHKVSNMFRFAFFRSSSQLKCGVQTTGKEGFDERKGPEVWNGHCAAKPANTRHGRRSSATGPPNHSLDPNLLSERTKAEVCLSNPRRESVTIIEIIGLDLNCGFGINFTFK